MFQYISIIIITITYFWHFVVILEWLKVILEKFDNLNRPRIAKF